mmetsp:Transcript_45519/g.142562  ORF Transcript_45519/g.142562 Transcript_45519/m.142562 type:complete len:109 (-) Transcript_45519:20-346(-)
MALRRVLASALMPSRGAALRLGVRSLSKTTKEGDVVPIKFMKDADDVKIMADDQYPDWLWELAQPGARALDKKLHENFEELTVDELQRLLKLERREKIKIENQDRGRD